MTEIKITRLTFGGVEYICPDCRMTGEPRPDAEDAEADYNDHKNGECIGPVMRCLTRKKR